MSSANTPVAVFPPLTAVVENVPLPVIATGGAAQSMPVNGPIGRLRHADSIKSAHDNLFTSGNLGKYSKILNSVLEKRRDPAGQAQEMEHFNP